MRKDFRFHYFWLYFVYQNFQNGYFQISIFRIERDLAENPAVIYLFNINNGKSRTMCGICSKLRKIQGQY